MHMVLSNIEPVTAEDWTQYLETFAFLSRLKLTEKHSDEDWDEAMKAVKRMREVLTGRLVAA
jgi:hypothetical protein